MACVGEIPDTRGPPMGYIQRSEMRVRWVLAGSTATQRQPVRSGSCELQVWLGDSRIWLTSGSFHLSIGKVTMEGDPILSQANTWGVTETFIIWRGRWLFRIGAKHGVISTGIAEFPWQIITYIMVESYRR